MHHRDVTARFTTHGLQFMIAVTQIQPRQRFRDHRRPQVGLLELSSGFGSNVTYVVGTAATQFSVKSPLGIGHETDSPEPAPGISESPLRAGMRIGKFKLLCRLGKGAQGDVWKARRLQPFVENVALKVLNPSLARQPNRLAQFRREAERGARLSGPSLLPVFEYGQLEGIIYMAMPLVEGTTLQEVIRGRLACRRGQSREPVHYLIAMDEVEYLRTVIRIMARAARALSQVHTHRVVHRDIKPANILLDRRRRYGVYLCDLGLGRDLEVATPEQMRDGAGTPMYMAPERLLKALADEVLCDIYSLGATLYEAVTLERPFRPPDDMPLSCLTLYLANEQPIRPRRVRPELPSELEAIILKAMARDPRNRYPSALALSHDLERFLTRWSFQSLRVAADSVLAGPHLDLPRRRMPGCRETG